MRQGGEGIEKEKEKEGRPRSLVFLCAHSFPRLIGSLDTRNNA